MSERSTYIFVFSLGIGKKKKKKKAYSARKSWTKIVDVSARKSWTLRQKTNISTLTKIFCHKIFLSINLSNLQNRCSGYLKVPNWQKVCPNYWTPLIFVGISAKKRIFQQVLSKCPDPQFLQFGVRKNLDLFNKPYICHNLFYLTVAEWIKLKILVTFFWGGKTCILAHLITLYTTNNIFAGLWAIWKFSVLDDFG